ncbi:MAG TPA: hypothetical protein VKT78_14145 [Fimbriimonadaceae bacterium]|nr:hypothetical protein [Fimbriimonadaceae bacterium]
MSQATWRKCGIVAALGVLVMPFLVAWSDVKGIQSAFDTKPVASWLTALFVVACLALQVACIVKLIEGKPGALLFGRRIAIFHASVALAIFTICAFGERLMNSMPFLAWFGGWFGLDVLNNVDIPMSEHHAYRPLGLLPWFVIAQWVFLVLATEGSSRRELWRGVAIAVIATSALHGLWTFSPSLPLNDPYYKGGHWGLFTDSMSIFFNIGVVVHLLALWLVCTRSKLDWLGAGIVGFGCLTIGLVLTHIAGSSAAAFQFSGSPDHPDAAKWIGSVLYIGWYDLSPYLPPIGYALTAFASVILFRTRARA